MKLTDKQIKAIEKLTRLEYDYDENNKYVFKMSYKGKLEINTKKISVKYYEYIGLDPLVFKEISVPIPTEGALPIVDILAGR